MASMFQNIDRKNYRPKLGGLEILRFIGPGLLVTVGFIDPGNWASNLAAGANYGYALLWMVTLSTIMLILLQHNVAHLGIATGLCLSEATAIYLKPAFSKILLISAMFASVSTSLAEILGGAIALNMLFKIPIPTGS
jgi:manganese transport protein